MSDAEDALLWQLRVSGVPVPTREYRFIVSRRWRFDLAWPTLKVAVEVEGAIWTSGRHTRGSGYEADMEKYNEAALAGWTVIRVSPEMVDDGRALAVIERAVRRG